jgi:LacI family transcriptional regulator
VQREKPTIYDVAAKAGVSANTVSRVINGKTGVSDSTRHRINRIIDELGYYPNIGARALRGGRPGCIGVIQTADQDDIPLSHPFVQWLFSEMYRVFGSHGERICFDLNPRAGRDNTADYGRSIWESLFSACVLVSPLAIGDTTIQRVHQSGVPYLSLGRLDSFPECSCATADYEQGAYMSTKYLLDRGHRSIAMLRAFPNYQPGVDRKRGYLRALAEAGIKPNPRLIQTANFRAADNANIVHRLLVDSAVTGLIDCSATEDAWSIREGARRAGRLPGRDLETVVWTYSSDAVVLAEASAHLWLPVREAASEGLELLAAWHRGERVEPINLQYAPALFETMPDVEMTRSMRLFGQ